jgi:hypothetical protein
VVKVFQLDDCEWWAGETLEACITEARSLCGRDSYPDAEQDGHELGAEEMQRLMYIDDGGPERVQRTFAEQLEREVAEGGVFPRLFASTEY